MQPVQIEHADPRYVTADMPRVVHQYPRIDTPIITIVTGALRSGKTSVVEALAWGSRNDRPELLTIFNEKKGSMARQDAGRMPEGVEAIGIGGCGCCRVEPKITELVTKGLVGGKKHIVFEQSGYSNAARLRDNFIRSFGTFVGVRFIAVVDATREVTVQAALAIHSADLVIISKSTGRSDLADAIQRKIKEVRGQNPVDVYVQEFPGDLTPQAFERLLLPPSARTSRSGRLGLGMASLATSKADEDQRRWERDHTYPLVMIARKGLTPARLKVLIETHPGHRLAGAKGWLQTSEGWSEFDFAPADKGDSKLTVYKPTSRAPTLFDGRPFIQLMASEAPPNPVHFLEDAMLLLDRTHVDSALLDYPSDEEILGYADDPDGVPTTFGEGDELAVQLMSVAGATNSLPNDERREFAYAFNTLVKRYATSRIVALEALWRELSNPKTLHPERLLEVGLALCYVIDRFTTLHNERVLGGQTLIDAVKGSLAATSAIKGLAGLTRLEIGGDTVPTQAQEDALVTCALSARRDEKLSKSAIMAAAQNLADLAERKKDARWADFATKLYARLKRQIDA